MGSVALTRDGQPHFVARINALTMESKRRWGKIEARAMVAHLRRSIEISLGEVETEDRSTFFTRSVLRWVALSPLPIPKNMKAPPVFLVPAEGTLTAEKTRLLEAVRRFVAAEAQEPEEWIASPLFGPLSRRDWARLNGKHLDHHLRQFSV